MVKPKGTTGATKMKIMAIISHNCEKGVDAYGYTIWQTLKQNFHIYLGDSDVRNVYHHLKELADLGYIHRQESAEDDPTKRCLYWITETGQGIENRYTPYLDIIRRSSRHMRKY